MKATDLERKRLVGPALAALAGALVLAASAYAAGGWLEGIERDYDRARADLDAAARQYREASDDRAVYQRYASRFRERADAGWIGDEERLSWIEALQAVNDDLRLPRLEYDIGEQVAAEVAGPAPSGRLDLRRSPMRLRIGALHEGDILALLAGLRDRGNGLMEVNYCRIERSGQGPDVVVDPGRANVDATCELHWYNLHLEPEPD